MNKSNFYRLIIFLTLVLAIQGCSPEMAAPTPYPTPKPKSVSDEVRDEYFASTVPLLDEWEAVIPLMFDRGRGWQDRIIKLQEIRKGYSQLEVDPYFDELHAQMILHMDCQIAAYVALVNLRDFSSGGLLEGPEVIFERCSFPGAE